MLAAQRGISFRNILSGVGALALLIGYLIFHANFVLTHAIEFAFPDWEVTHRAAWPRPLGGVVASDITLVSRSGQGSFHFDRVELDVPFFQYYRSVFQRGALVTSVRDLHFEFSDGRGDVSTPFTSEIALFGNLTAIPFEAEGCFSDSAWSEHELEEMGLSPGHVKLVLDYHSEPQRFVKQQILDSPGMGHVAYRREMVKHDDIPMLRLVESSRNEVALDEWHVKDDGFVAARNRFCAKKDKVNPGEFVQRHVRSVKRLLAATGLAPQAGLESAYRDFARAGGSIDLVVHYDPPIGGELYASADLGTWLPRLHGEFAIDGKAQALAFDAVPPRQLPDDDELSTWQLVMREDAAAGRVDGAPDTTVAPSPDLVATAASVTRGAPPAVPAPSPSSEPLTIAAAAPAMPGATVTVVLPSSPAPEPAATGITDYRKLATQTGKAFTVYRKGRETIRIEVLRVTDNGDVVVRRRVSGGSLEFKLEREGFERADE
jgi:hypothetical protein